MSDTEQPNTGKAPDRKWDWSNPQTVLAALGIVAGLAGSVFGVAMAAPYGQDLLCKSFGVSCPRVEFKNPRLSVNVIDFDGWCADWLDQQAKQAFPPPGYTGSTMDCSLDFSVAGPPGFGGQISYVSLEPDGRLVGPDIPGGVMGHRGMLLALHLSMEHAATATDTPLTLRVLCRRSDAATDQMAPVPCELSPPRYDAADPFGERLAYSWQRAENAEAPLPEGAIEAMVLKDELDFIQRWRLDIDNHPNAELPPGLYSVEIAAGAPGESVEPIRIGATFEVYPPS